MMTIQHVINQAAALCSLDTEASKTVLYAALNRALDEIGTLFPNKTVETIPHFLPTPIYALPSAYTVSEGSPLRFDADGVRAFSLEACGEGEVTVLVDGKNVYETAFSSESVTALYHTVSELADAKDVGRVTLLFRGKGTLSVLSAALFDAIPEKACFHRPEKRYRVSDFSHRFLSFTGKVTKNGAAIPVKGGDVALYEDSLAIRSAAKGVYGVEYMALPDAVSPDEEKGEITLSPKAFPLLLPLTAYYAALEDENPASGEFLARFETALRYLNAASSDTVLDVYGW